MDLLENYRQVKVKACMVDFLHRSKPLFKLNLAYAQMLLEQGYLNKKEKKLIVAGLKEAQKKVAKDSVLKSEDGDIWFLYEKALSQSIDPQIAAKLHIGRSRNDMYFSMYRMSLRDAVIELFDEILNSLKILEELANKNLSTVIPYYTYGQPSQPGTWAHYLMTIHNAFEADLERLQEAYRRINCCPMGAAAGIGTSFNLNKERIAELLGFDSVIENTCFANSAEDYFLELISACAIINTTLSRVAADMVFLSSAECGVLDFDHDVCESSSIMPQKKNAQAAEILRAETHHFFGYLTTAFGSAGSISLFPIHETVVYFDTFWDHLNILIDNIKLLEVNLLHSHVRESVALEKSKNGFTAATAMAEKLTVETGIPFTLTHHVVGGMIRSLMDRDDLQVDKMTPKLLEEQSVKWLGQKIVRSTEEISLMLDPLESLKAKTTGGTPRPDDTKKLISMASHHRKVFEKWLSRTKEKLQETYESL